MDSAVLVKSDREAGWELLNALRKEQFPMTAAFWQYLPEGETWRLFIVTPLVLKDGPLAAYQRLRVLLDRLSESVTEGFSLANISLIDENEERVRNLKRRHGTVEWEPRLVRRLSLSPEEAYIYLLE